MIEPVQSNAAGNPVGERLREAREAKGLSLDDVASVTRIPTRHLLHIERGEWDALPAPTYSVGFARAYANAVGLNGAEMGAELRAQLGGTQRTAAVPFYEPADPARVPSRSVLIISAILALLVVAGYMIWRNQALGGDAADVAEVAVPAPQQPVAAQPRPAAATPAAAAAGPVVITAADDVWLRVYEGNGGPKLLEKTLKAGERYEVPATARQPQILTGRPDAIRVTVGQTEIPPLGPPQRTIADVSLLGSDLLARVQGAAAPAQQPNVAPQGQ